MVSNNLVLAHRAAYAYDVYAYLMEIDVANFEVYEPDQKTISFDDDRGRVIQGISGRLEFMRTVRADTAELAVEIAKTYGHKNPIVGEAR